jgi:hypothetical protein
MTKTEKQKQFVEERKMHYNSLTSVYCSPLKACVHFNSDGFYHMIFKTNRRKRKISAQFARLALIPLIKPVIKNAKKIQETRIEKGKKMRGEKIETFHALVEVVGKCNVRVKVVIRKVENGGFFFHSIMRLSRQKNTR